MTFEQYAGLMLVLNAIKTSLSTLVWVASFMAGWFVTRDVGRILRGK